MTIHDRITLLCRITLAIVGLLYIFAGDKLAVVAPLHYGIALICLAVSE